MSWILLAACARAAPNPALPAEVLPLRMNGATLRAYVADDPAEREQGLMGVTELGPDEGMVFVYPAPSARYFWMKDTPLPLSIAFCDATGKVVTLADMAPLNTTLPPSGAPVVYAVEANKGWFAAHEVHVGDTIVGLPGPSKR